MSDAAMQARDGAADARLACGTEADAVTADAEDTPDGDCETVSYP